MSFFELKSGKSGLLLSVLILLSGLSSIVMAEPKDDSNYKDRPLDVRVERLERLMSSQKQLELLYRMKQLQEENQQLRSLLEEQSNEIRQLNQKQRELYADLNRRLSMMEGGNMPPAQSEDVSSIEGTKDKTEDAYKIPDVVDKSTTRPSKYGVTEREEVVVEQASQQVALSVEEVNKPTKPPVAVIKPMSEKERKAEQQAYQKAYDELRAKQYNKARDSFIAFTKKYPSGRYAHIAQYWVAESSYAQKNYKQAITDYQYLLDAYPFSPKKAEAELKKAFSYYELGDNVNTRKTLEQLLATYPDTTEAGQAKRLLKKL